MLRQSVTARTDRDIYRLSASADEATTRTMAERLEFRVTDEGYTRLSQAYFSRLPLAAARRILSLGCGTGVEVRALRRGRATAAEVIGIDHSPGLVEIARRITEKEGLSEGVSYEVGDAHHLPFPYDVFDVVTLHTLLSHVDDPLGVLREAGRVARQGGVIAVFDGDYESLTFAYPDTELAKRLEAMLMHLLIANPRVMRDMPYLIHQTGLTLEEAWGDVYANIGEGGFWTQVPEVYSAVLARAELLPTDVIENWKGYQASAVESGIFFAASNFYTYLVRKPG